MQTIEAIESLSARHAASATRLPCRQGLTVCIECAHETPSYYPLVPIPTRLLPLTTSIRRPHKSMKKILRPQVRRIQDNAQATLLPFLKDL